MNAILRLTAPLHHGAFGADTGNAAALRRIPLLVEDRLYLVPAVSGGAIRGVIRRILMRDLLDAHGITPGDVGPLAYERLYAALANGGHLDGAEVSIDPVERRALRASLPPLSALGAALYTYMLSRRVEVGIAWLVCSESRAGGVVGPRAWLLRMAEELVVDYGTVRHVDRDEHAPERSGVTPMPVETETIVAGAELECRIGTARATELEASAMAWALSRITHIGGKAGSGLGAVEVTHDGDPAPYADWRDSAHDATREVLRRLATDLLPREKRTKAKSGRGPLLDPQTEGEG